MGMFDNNERNKIIIIIILWFSMFLQSLVVIAYMKRWKQHPISVIFCHFILLIITGIVFLLNFVNGYKSDVSSLYCRTQAGLINYFLLAASNWTLIHLFNIYNFVVRCDAANYMKYYLIIGFVLPIFPTVVTSILSEAEMFAIWCYHDQAIYRFIGIYLWCPIQIIFGVYWSVSTLRVVYREVFQLKKIRSQLERSSLKHGKKLRPKSEKLTAGSAIRLTWMSFFYVMAYMIAVQHRLREVFDTNTTAVHTVGSVEIGLTIISFAWGCSFATTPYVLSFWKEKLFGGRYLETLYFKHRDRVNDVKDIYEASVVDDQKENSTNISISDAHSKTRDTTILYSNAVALLNRYELGLLRLTTTTTNNDDDSLIGPTQTNSAPTSRVSAYNLSSFDTPGSPKRQRSYDDEIVERYPSASNMLIFDKRGDTENTDG